IIEDKGFVNPTDPQTQAIPPILDGKNVLLIAPTGTGKTEAAFLPVLSKFLEIVEKTHGIKILYVTPLRSLNRDILQRLEWWCEKLDIKVSVRHGDTDTKERTLQSRSPPDVLITTPETLQAIMPGRTMRRHLASVQWVIIDEVHEFAEDKRGSQLSLALERLRMITGKELQVIGLSATIGSPKKVASFLVGTDRPVEIVRVPVARLMEFQIIYPTPSEEDHALAAQLYTHPEVATRLRVMRLIIEGHKSVLLFTNTRSIAEILASRFKVWDVDFPVSIHHGSLAKTARIAAETGLKGGELKGLVCTSSLELGIDIGKIDMCIQYMSPRQVARLVQRVGRSGHNIGRVAKGIIITMDSDDTLEAMAIARRAYLEDLEPVSIPEKPLDVLAHEIIGLFTQSRKWDFNQVLEVFTKAYPYRKLSEDDLTSVFTYMHTRYPRLVWVSFEDKVAMRPKNVKDMYQFYYENLSMIPDEKSYLIIDETNEAPIGILDEAFVAEYGDPGTKFIVRGSPWKIVTVYGDKIYVKPIDDPTGAIPSWVGEEIPVPFAIAEEVGGVRSFVEEKLEQKTEPEAIASMLTEKYPADKETILKAIQEIIEQFNKGYSIPTEKRIVIESGEECTFIHACFGSLTNRTLATLLGHLLSEKTGCAVGIQEDPYRIMLTTEAVNAEAIKELLYELTKMDINTLSIDAFKAT
ncbi:MAG: DEAD/DEAH box helicase, partial [Candidatus Bathyarchaeota archaeon]